VSLKWKTVQIAACGTLLLLVAGCSGINASKSVSPIDFLLPGAGNLFHMQNTPPQAVPDTNNTFAALNPPASSVQSP
jgi:hypothetical protein